MPDGPSVSVCIPAHQAERHIEQTLRSALAQTYPNLEVLVLDNACSDGTPRILERYADPRLRVVRNPSVLPISENWNRLVGLASGELVKVLCADDLVHPDIVSRQVEAFASHPTLALVSCRRHLITEDSAVVALARGLSGLTGFRQGRDAVRRVVRHGGNPIGEPACVLFRRDHFRRTGRLRRQPDVPDGHRPVGPAAAARRLLRHPAGAGRLPRAAARRSPRRLSCRAVRRPAHADGPDRRRPVLGHRP